MHIPSHRFNLVMGDAKSARLGSGTPTKWLTSTLALPQGSPSYGREREWQARWQGQLQMIKSRGNPLASSTLLYSTLPWAPWISKAAATSSAIRALWVSRRPLCKRRVVKHWSASTAHSKAAQKPPHDGFCSLSVRAGVLKCKLMAGRIWYHWSHYRSRAATKSSLQLNVGCHIVKHT